MKRNHRWTKLQKHESTCNKIRLTVSQFLQNLVASIYFTTLLVKNMLKDIVVIACKCVMWVWHYNKLECSTFVQKHDHIASFVRISFDFFITRSKAEQNLFAMCCSASGSTTRSSSQKKWKTKYDAVFCFVDACLSLSIDCCQKNAQ